MYNFDMQRLLETFEGDPEKLAKAFTDQLNNELEKQRKRDEVNELAYNVSYAWNTFCNAWFEINGLKVEDAKNMHIDSATVPELLMAILALAPEIEKYMTLLETVENTKEKVNNAKEQIVDKIKPVAKETYDDFEKTMQDFFRKYKI